MTFHVAGARLAACLLAVSAIVGACGSVDEFQDPKVSNATSDTVELFFVSGGVTTSLGTIKSGVTTQLTAFGQRCAVGTFIARTLSGAEVARRTVPLCPDAIWTIGP
jgi:hypothetical protein